MKFIILFTFLIISNKAIAQGVFTTYNDNCKSCHPEIQYTFNNNKNLYKTIERMFINQCNIKPNKKQLNEMTTLGKTYQNKQTLIQIIKIDKKEFRGEATNFTRLQLIKNNKIIQTRFVENYFFSFPMINGIDKLTIIKNNKKKEIPIKEGIFIIN